MTLIAFFTYWAITGHQPSWGMVFAFILGQFVMAFSYERKASR